ncbi:hypothetical protein LX32DRAFT_304042 [Colletotrichum zoysiae]|uniref:Uncharacterized protein n=1 Tax=Colletotrichum zoysiae TaxID=1216348 RepID=A0AAD9LUB9_9PEZI|nr:hypothetical protein LX32DRAFT_304042 [Colletotrichum zoysiae]
MGGRAAAQQLPLLQRLSSAADDGGFWSTADKLPFARLFAARSAEAWGWPRPAVWNSITGTTQRAGAESTPVALSECHWQPSPWCRSMYRSLRSGLVWWWPSSPKLQLSKPQLPKVPSYSYVAERAPLVRAHHPSRSGCLVSHQSPKGLSQPSGDPGIPLSAAGSLKPIEVPDRACPQVLTGVNCLFESCNAEQRLGCTGRWNGDK